MRKKWMILILAVALTITMLPAAAFGVVTTARTPAGAGNTSLKWSYDFQSGGMDFSRAPTVPALIGGALYVGSADKVYKFNKDTGKILATSPALPGRMGYGTTPLIGDETGVYVFVTGSKVVKLSLDLKKILWTSKGAFGGQNITPIKLIDGRIYGGTWGDDEDGGVYFCLDASDGERIWKVSDSEGFYWAGAAKSGDTVFFATDASTKAGKKHRTSARIYASENGEAPKKVAEEEGISIRSTPAVDREGYIYFTSGKHRGGGALTKYRYAEGKLTRVGEVSMGNSRNTPVIDEDTVFVGDGDLMTGGAGKKIYAIDRNAMTIRASVNAPAQVQGEMLVARSGNGYRIYATYNNMPGGLFYAEMPADASRFTASGVTFLPKRAQYCISDVVCDEATGTLYYKNDAGVIMAVKEGVSGAPVTGVKAVLSGSNGIKVSWNGRENVTAYEVRLSQNGKTFTKAVSGTDTALSVGKLTRGKTYTVKVGCKLLAGKATDSASVKVTIPPAATRVSGKNIKKKTVKLRWKKAAGAAGYTVYRATSKNGSYKAIKTVNAGAVKYTDKKLKKKKTCYYKVRPFTKSGSKKVYGPWSNTVKVKVRK